MTVKAVLQELEDKEKKKVPKQGPRTRQRQRSPTPSIVEVSDDESIEELEDSDEEAEDSEIYSCINVEDDE
jgi:hypothetical protein